MKRVFGLALAVPAALGVVLGVLLTYAKRIGGKYWVALALGAIIGIGIVKLHMLVST